MINLAINSFCSTFVVIKRYGIVEVMVEGGNDAMK